MGQTGEFKEYQFTGSYDSVYSLTNPPPVSSVFVSSSTGDVTGPFNSIQVVSAATFSVLSSSLGSSVVGVSIPAGTILHGSITKFRLSAGSVIANNKDIW